eukprot:jgi/Chrzof1/13455/UNPLg00538.t1
MDTQILQNHIMVHSQLYSGARGYAFWDHKRRAEALLSNMQGKAAAQGTGLGIPQGIHASLQINAIQQLCTPMTEPLEFLADARAALVSDIRLAQSGEWPSSMVTQGMVEAALNVEASDALLVVSLNARVAEAMQFLTGVVAPVAASTAALVTTAMEALPADATADAVRAAAVADAAVVAARGAVVSVVQPKFHIDDKGEVVTPHTAVMRNFWIL